MKGADGGVSPATLKELQMQDHQIEDLEQQLAELHDELNEMQQRASSRGGKRLAALPGTSIPLNEFEDTGIPLH